jgi:hypothetical protein
MKKYVKSTTMANAGILWFLFALGFVFCRSLCQSKSDGGFEKACQSLEREEYYNNPN